jgi:hypothetical protein
MNGTRRYKAHKHTVHCPIKDCKYTSRVPNDVFYLTNKNSVHSKICPKHRLGLVKLYLPLKNKKSKGKPSTLTIAQIREKVRNKLNNSCLKD